MLVLRLPFLVEIEFGNVSLKEGGKPEYPEKNLFG